MEVWSNFVIKMPSKIDYKVVEIIIQNIFEDRLGWVPEYDEFQLSIRVEDIFGTEEDIVVYVKELSNQLFKCAEHQKNVDHKDVVENVSFCVRSSTGYYGSGENIDLIIEMKNRLLTVKESDIYSGPYLFESYEDLCDAAKRNGLNIQIIDEDEFDSSREYVLTANKVYAEDAPKDYDLILSYSMGKYETAIQECSKEEYDTYAMIEESISSQYHNGGC